MEITAYYHQFNVVMQLWKEIKDVSWLICESDIPNLQVSSKKLDICYAFLVQSTHETERNEMGAGQCSTIGC